MTTTDKLIKLISQSINMIADDRDRLRAENKRLRKSLKRLRDEYPSDANLCIPSLHALWAMIKEPSDDEG